VGIELFVPTGGLLGVLAATCFGSSIYCAYRAWYEPGHYGVFIGYVVSLIVMIPTVIGMALYLLPRTKFGHSVLAMPPTAEEIAPFVDEEQRMKDLIHQRGKAVTLFSPGGIALIGHEKHHAESEGMLIDAGEPIVVVGVKGNRLVVRPASLYDAAVSEPALMDEAEPTNSEHSSAIDFDLPDNA